MVVVVVAAAVLVFAVEGGPVEAGGHGLGLVPIAQDDGLGAQLRSPGTADHVVEVEGAFGSGKGHLAVLGLREGEAQVLQEVLVEEARCPIAVEGLGAELVHGSRGAHAAEGHVTHLRGVDPTLLRDRDGLGHAEHRAGEAHLVAELGSLAGAGLAEAVDAR